jgi:adenylosuccinate synthase
LVEVEAIDAKTYVAQSRNIAPEKPSLAHDVETKPLVQEDAPAVSATESRVINSDKATMSESGIFVQVGAFKLPENARQYLMRISEVCEVPIDMVSTGPDRDETILLRHPFKS